MRAFVADGTEIAVAIVADFMAPPLTFLETDEIRIAALQLVKRDLRAAPVLDASGQLLGMIDQHDIVGTMTAATGPASEPS